MHALVEKNHRGGGDPQGLTLNHLMATMFFVVMSMGFALFPSYAKAAEVVDTWDGTADTSWYQEGSEEYALTTAEQFAGLAELVDGGTTFEGVTIVLQSELDLSGHEWNTIGAYAGSPVRPFSGVFDGNGHTISGLTQTEAYVDCGLFAYVKSTMGHAAIVKNVQLEQVDIDITVPDGATGGGLYFGPLAVYASNRNGLENGPDVIIDGCSVSGSFSNQGDGGGTMGGLLGMANYDVQVIACSSTVDIAYYNSEADPFTGCTFGGIVGFWGNRPSGAKVVSSYFAGSITSKFSGSIASGIIGLTTAGTGTPSSPTIANCFVFPSSVELAGVIGEDSLFAPVMVAMIYTEGSALVSDCYWLGEAGEPGVYVADSSTGAVIAPENQSSFGRPLTKEEFSEASLVEELNRHADEGTVWNRGIGGFPVLSYQSQIALADYESVDKALVTVPDDLSGYTAASVDVLQKAIDALDYKLPVDRQSEVNAMADAIKAAVNNLEELANYQVVDDALARVPSDLSPYTEDSVGLLQSAIAAVERGLGVSRQEDVNKMAVAIDAAIAGLERVYVPPARPTYDVDIEDTDHGTVEVTPARPHDGDEVTITPTPDEGYEVGAVTVTDEDGTSITVTDSGDGTWTFEQPAGNVTVAVTFHCLGGEHCPTRPFGDVPVDAWYHDALDWAVEQGLLSGFADGTLGPDSVLSRAQLATVLWRRAGQPEAAAALTFEDCDPEAFYADAVAWAAEQGVILGYGDGTDFGPDDPVTREQLATILWRQAGEPEGSADLAAFPDGDETSTYAIPALEWAVDSGVLSGFGDGTLAPSGVLARAMLAAMLQRMGA